MTSQREADRVLREWAARAGWQSVATPAAEAPARNNDRRSDAAEADVVWEGVSVLREQLRALEERLEKKREK
jgi:hypothetical protein